MSAIFKREFRAFFQSVIGYLFIAANLVLLGIYFYAYNLQGMYPYFSYTISSSILIFLITIPILTMRIISEDRKNKTDQLILTAPVSVVKIVLGKFFAVAAVFMILAGIICLYPPIMGQFGDIPYKETYVAIFGFVLVGLAGIAVGVFLSSITESQIIAAVLTFVALFVSYLMAPICSFISSTGNWFTEFLSVFDIFSKFEQLLNGTLDLKSVVYLVSVVVLMLFLTVQTIQKRRYSVSFKNMKMGAYSMGAIVFFTAAIVFINLVMAKLPERYTIFDMTDNQMYSLTDDSKNMLRALDQDAEIIVYCAESNFDESIGQLIRRYAGETSHVTITYVDPVTNPQFYKNYSTSPMATGTIVVRSGEKFRIITQDELYVYESTLNYYTYSYDNSITGIDAEGQITSALAYVTGEEEHVVYFTTGHGEDVYEESYCDLISKANASYNSVNLITLDEVPEDAECLIINNPTGDFNQDDMDKVAAYIDRGGNVIISLPATGNDVPIIGAFLKEYGLTLQNYLVADSSRSRYFQTPYYLLPAVNYSSYTTTISGEYYIFCPYTLAMTVDDELPENVDVIEILSTSSKSFAKDMKKEITSDEMEDGDIEGPFAPVVAVTKTADDGTTGKLFVSSCANLFTESASAMVSGGNEKLFTEVMSRFINIENVVSIPAKMLDVTYLTLTEENIRFWKNVTIFIIPGGLLIFGIIFWLRRRKK